MNMFPQSPNFGLQCEKTINFLTIAVLLPNGNDMTAHNSIFSSSKKLRNTHSMSTSQICKLTKLFGNRQDQTIGGYLLNPKAPLSCLQKVDVTFSDCQTFGGTNGRNGQMWTDLDRQNRFVQMSLDKKLFPEHPSVHPPQGPLKSARWSEATMQKYMPPPQTTPGASGAQTIPMGSEQCLRATFRMCAKRGDRIRQQAWGV